MNSTPFLRNPIAWAIVALVILFLAANTFAIVPETRQGVVLRFGEPVLFTVRESRHAAGASGPG